MLARTAAFTVVYCCSWILAILCHGGGGFRLEPTSHKNTGSRGRRLAPARSAVASSSPVLMSHHSSSSSSSSKQNGDDEHDPQLVAAAQRHFPFVDVSIGRVLVGPATTNHAEKKQVAENHDATSRGRFQLRQEDNRGGYQHRGGGIQIVENANSNDSEATAQDLVPLAQQCDALVFGADGREQDDDSDLTWTMLLLEPTTTNKDDAQQLQALTQLATTTSTTTDEEAAAAITVSLILALNALESTLRQSIPGGRAPLLTTLLARYRQSHQEQQTQEQQPTSGVATATSTLLDLLLLPTKTGINLRNLLWHGFVGATVKLRPWLALVLLLLRQLQGEVRRGNEETTAGGSSDRSLSQQKESVSESTRSSPLLFRNSPVSSNSSSRQRRLLDVVARGGVLRRCLGTAKETSSPSQQLIVRWLIPDHPSHRLLWEFCVQKLSTTDEQKAAPAMIVAVLLTLLLEHGLRLLWCESNHRTLDRVARPHHFYVTLDGHGQRHKHDVILHPYVGSGGGGVDSGEGNRLQHRNRLVEKLGGCTMALLTDLFISGSGGPNLRAALSHGLYDDQLDRELRSVVLNKSWSCCDEEKSMHVNWDMVDALLAATEQVAMAVAIDRNTSLVPPFRLQQYRPIFSFTSTTMGGLLDVHSTLERLSDLVRNTEVATTLPGVPDSVGALAVPLDFIRIRVEHVVSWTTSRCKTRDNNNDEILWTADDVFAEHETNRILEPLGATRSLLLDIAVAGASMTESVEQARSILLANRDETASRTSSRQRKQMQRVAACGRVVLDVYSFAAHVAILNLEHALKRHYINNNQLGREKTSSLTIMLDDSEQLKAVERTRMVVSTVSTFAIKNPQRAWKAVDLYAKGKVVKRICLLAQGG